MLPELWRECCSLHSSVQMYLFGVFPQVLSSKVEGHSRSQFCWSSLAKCFLNLGEDVIHFASRYHRDYSARLELLVIFRPLSCHSSCLVHLAPIVKVEHRFLNERAIVKYEGLWDFKPMYSFGKWWKWKISLMGFVYRVVRVLKALWIVLSETINILRKLHKTNIFGMPPKILP